MPVFGMSLVLGWFACAVAVVAPWLAKALAAARIRSSSSSATYTVVRLAYVVDQYELRIVADHTLAASSKALLRITIWHSAIRPVVRCERCRCAPQLAHCAQHAVVPYVVAFTHTVPHRTQHTTHSRTHRRRLESTPKSDGAKCHLERSDVATLPPLKYLSTSARDRASSQAAPHFHSSLGRPVVVVQLRHVRRAPRRGCAAGHSSFIRRMKLAAVRQEPPNRHSPLRCTRDVSVGPTCHFVTCAVADILLLQLFIPPKPPGFKAAQ